MRSEQERSKYLSELGPEYFWLEVRYSLARWLLRRYAGARLDPDKGKVLVDLGCGPGNCLRGMPQELLCLGTDVERQPLLVARAVSHACVYCSDAAAQPLRPNTADFAMLIDVAEHVEEDRRLFAEVYRVLKPGGLAFFTTPAYQFLWGRHDERVGHHRRYHRDGICELLRGAGFRVLEKRYLLPFSFFALLGLRVWKRFRGSPGDDFFHLSPFFNSVAKTWLFAESTLSRFLTFPWGLIIYVVAEREDS